MRAVLLFFLFCFPFLVCGQNIQSFGVFGGLTVPITLDEGLREDSRFKGKLTFRSVPAGLSYGYDYGHLGFGFVVTPSYVKIGQEYDIYNITNGTVGTRNIKMDYICLPIAFKIHIINFSFIRINLITILNFSYLVSGKEILTFSASTLRYPASVRVPDDPGYAQQPDGGIAVPRVDNQVYVSHDKFNPIQIFAGLGVRSYIDLSDKWTVNLDARCNYGILDSRTEAYKQKLAQPENAPDLNGARNDLYLSIEVGVSRIVQIEKRHKVKTSNKPLKKRTKFQRPR